MPPPSSGSDSSPYSLSTAPGFNPYTNSRAGMGNTPYNMPVDNTPIGGGYTAGMGMGMGMGMGFGYIPNSAGYGYALMGTAEYTRAAGQYWKDIQQARFAREQVSQMQLETARRRVQYEAWYETMRPTAPKMRDAEMATDLDRARKDPPDSEVTSGRALNVLLRSIQSSGRASSGPAIALDEETAKHINLSGGSTSGNVGLLKGGVNLNWPDSLMDSGFDEARKRITRNLKNAVETLKDREPLSSALRRDIQADFKTLNDKLNESANDLSPAQYIEARRFMNQLNGSIKALSDPKASNFFTSWTARGKTVGEMVENMTKDGLTFSSAAPGDESYYRALYQGLRAFEQSLQSGSR